MMAQAVRPCWRNCAAEADEEILAIDAMDDSLAPLPPDAVRTRGLITAFESCYREVERHIDIIIRSIALSRPAEGPEGRWLGQRPEIKRAWHDAREILSAWQAGSPESAAGLDVQGIPAEELLSGLGARTPLKAWQVQRVMEKITDAIDPSQAYENIMLAVGDYGEAVEKPALRTAEDDDGFLPATKEAAIHDTVDGEASEIPLALAIDMLQPCNWNFACNLRIVLQAIGGNSLPREPFACCGRNITMTPALAKLKTVASALRAFCDRQATDDRGAGETLTPLGEVTPLNRWLAASFDKTIRLQLHL